MSAPSAALTLATLHAEISGAIAEGARLAAAAPPPWAALLVGAGVVFLLHGARHRVLLALPGGAAVGLLAVRIVMPLLGRTGAVQTELLWVAAGTGALACAGWPPLFPALATAVPGVIVGWVLAVAQRPWVGALAGGAGGALVGALAREWVAALAAGGLGGAAVIAGSLGLLSRRAVGEALIAHPMAILAIWSVLAVAGAAFHAGRAWPVPGARAPAPEPYAAEVPLRDGGHHDEWRG